VPDQEAKDEAAAQLSPPEIIDHAEEDDVEAHSLYEGEVWTSCHLFASV
jgi:hypothetical protein